MTVESSTGAFSHLSTDWHSINWKAVNETVRRLQARIVKATKEGKWHKVHALQHLLTHSFSGKALAVRRVTENQELSRNRVPSKLDRKPSQGRYSMLEPDEGKPSRPVLRRGGGSNSASLAGAATAGYEISPTSVFIDEGVSGARLDRPALDRLRDLAAEGAYEVLLVTVPDRLARRYAYQVLLVEEFTRCGCEVVFVQHSLGASPEEQMLLQINTFANYEKLTEGCAA